MMSIGRNVIRGAVCGLLAGLVAGIFALLIAEPVIDHAITLEQQRLQAEAAQRGSAPPPEVFSRPTQHTGLVVGTSVLGVAFGGLFGMLFHAIGRRRPGPPWTRAIALGGALFLGYFIVPFLRYPANPPGVGNPDSIGLRSSVTLIASVIGLIVVAVAWRLNAWLRARGMRDSIRQLVVGATFAGLVGASYAVLPSNPDPVNVPATLLWNFRVLSVSTQLLLWATLAVCFGLWTEWSIRRTAADSRPAKVSGAEA